MKLTAKVKLQPDQDQHRALFETLAIANLACNQISDTAWATRTFSQFNLHPLVYRPINESYNLTAQIAAAC